VDVGLSRDLLVNVLLGGDFLMNVGFSLNLFMHVGFGFHFLMDVGLGGNFLVKVGLGEGEHLSGIVIGVDGDHCLGSIGDGRSSVGGNGSGEVGLVVEHQLTVQGIGSGQQLSAGCGRDGGEASKDSNLNKQTNKLNQMHRPENDDTYYLFMEQLTHDQPFLLYML